LPGDPASDLTAELAETWRLGRTGQSVAALSRAKVLFQQARDAGDTVSTASSLTQIAWFCLQLGQAEHGLDAAIAAKRLYVRGGNITGEAHAAAIFSWLLLEMGLNEEAYEEAGQAVELAEAQDEPGVLAYALNAKASVLMYARQPLLSGPLLERAIELMQSRGEPSAVALFLINLAYGQVTCGEIAEQEGRLDEGRDWRETAVKTNDIAIVTAESGGDGWNLRTALCNGAEYHALLGRPEEAHAYLQRWLGVAGQPGMRERIHYLYTLGELLTRTGELSAALDICREAVALADATTHVNHQANTVRRLGDIHEAMGDFQAALAMHKRYHGLYEVQLSEATRRRAHIADIRLENGRLRAEAERLADEAARDGLTGLPNRRSFDQMMAAMAGTELALGILDLDFFKSVNDRFSHVVGDAVLRRTADLLAARASADLRAFRLGGEEFALVFPNHGLDYAVTRCEAICSDIAVMDWQDLAAGLAITASIGVAIGPAGSALMAAADRRLYRAKAAGRNRVTGDEPPEVRQATG
jgi:diguanylate cyclase